MNLIIAKNRKEWIYEYDLDALLRFSLGVKGSRTLICFGVNPSTAKPNNPDRTIQSVERICHSNGFDSWIMLNLCPQRTTNPNKLNVSLNLECHKRNMEVIEKYLGNGSLVWEA